ncbi:MAG: hypothetical protein HFI34_04065 [Lachnospiraceae bacterium]|nr:hypothetical protein [Lachnospiraceae bacterium]
MQIGAYQFAVIKSIENNFEIIENAIGEAAERNVKLLIFPRCALTGYPPRDFRKSLEVDFLKLDSVYEKLQKLSNSYDKYIVAGTILKREQGFYNTARIGKE